MAVLFMDGVEHYSTLAELKRKWTTALVSGTWSTSTAYSCPGGGAVLVPASNLDTYTIGKQLASNYATLIAGGWYMSPSANAARNLIQFNDNGTNQISLGVNASGFPYVHRNGTTLATGTVAVSNNAWNHFEFKATIHNTTGSYEVRQNGVTILSATNVNTRASANNYANQYLAWNNYVGGNWYMKHLYVLDTSGSVANDFVGTVRVATLRPTAPGNSAEWAPYGVANYMNVADTIASDDDITYNTSSTANQTDTFALNDVPTGATVYGIQQIVTARQDAGSARTIAPVLRIGSTNYAGTSVSLTSSYAMFLEPKSVSPATSSGFTVSELNGLEAGYKLVS